jgi:2,4-dienoyl-CoA reductase (NADPH2)
LKREVAIPLVTTNRINMPEIAEQVLEQGCADMVSMARPFLADPDLVLKAMEGRSDEINTCIACNQACLDHTFSMQVCSCLVNPRACHETELNYSEAAQKKKIAVIGAGPAGLAASTVLAERGHAVDLYEADQKIGGQFNMAKLIPGKEEYHETIRYYNRMLEKHSVNVHLGHKVTGEELSDGKYDEVIVATGVSPRDVEFSGKDHPKVVYYDDVLNGHVKVGKTVAIIGAGGIGFDVAEYLSHEGPSVSMDIDKYMNEWGVDMHYKKPGSLAESADPSPSPRTIYLLKRSSGKHGKNLGKTTGWIHRSSLAMKGVKMLANVSYDKVDDQGLHIEYQGENQILGVDHVVICAGQESLRTVYDHLLHEGQKVHLIGGADEARELDAKKAIDQASRLAASI